MDKAARSHFLLQHQPVIGHFQYIAATEPVSIFLILKSFAAYFLLAAILALVYTSWAFGVSMITLPTFPVDKQPGQVAQAIIEFVSGLLLVLIIMEMLGTVIHYLQVHATSLRPFLFIGIVSAFL